MAMGVLLRRNHRRVAANMVEVSVGLPAFLPCLFVCPSVCLSVCLACRSLALLEISKGGLFRVELGWFRGGENWSSVWIGPRRGNCDMQPQTGGQKVERSEMNLLPYMEHQGTRHRGKRSLQYVVCRVTSKVDDHEVVRPAFPRNCLAPAPAARSPTLPWASAPEHGR